MGKKALRRALERSQIEREQERAAAARALAEARGSYERLQAALLEAGYVRVTGDARTKGDRLRAARSGVIVLADVELLPHSQFAAEQDEPVDTRYGASLRAVPQRSRYRLSLQITGDPELLGAIADSVAGRRP